MVAAEVAPANSPAVSRVAICRVDQIYNRKQRKSVFVPSAERSKTKISSKYVLVVRRVCEGSPPFETVIDIRGSALLKVLSEFYKDAAGMRLSEDPPVIKPRTLYHAASELRSRKKAEEAVMPQEQQDRTLIFELNAALTFIDEEFALETPRIDTLKRNGEITFDSLWAIIPPNELVYTIDKLGEPVVYRALYHKNKDEPDRSVSLDITCSFVDYDGSKFGIARTVKHTIAEYPGSKKISELNVFPLSFHPKTESVRQDLLLRGQKRIGIKDRRFNNYKGHGLVEKDGGDSDSDIPPREKVNFHGRVIIDHATYDQIVPSNRFVPEIQTTIPVENLTQDHILTLPSMLYGFSLGDKTWGGFAVSRLSNIEWDDSIWESLVLSKMQKHLIRTLVKSHVNETSGFDDFVKEKGKGLIGLLTGPPGVGKTLTAEAVAEIVRRPLYMLSSGELGDAPRLMDINLKQILELAQTWGAVLLLDEADVFLSKRDNTSMERNAVVSIFLRQLEYYQGILILTTNRKENIDEAFQSRIHFCHNYPDLLPDARKEIWKGFLQRAEADPRVHIKIGSEGLDSLSLLPLNGRQIKNTMKMAQFMATEEKAAITVDSIELVAQSLQNFSF